MNVEAVCWLLQVGVAAACSKNQMTGVDRVVPHSCVRDCRVWVEQLTTGPTTLAVPFWPDLPAHERQVFVQVNVRTGSRAVRQHVDQHCWNRHRSGAFTEANLAGLTHAGAARTQRFARRSAQSSIAAKLAPDWHQHHPENKKVSRR